MGTNLLSVCQIPRSQRSAQSLLRRCCAQSGHDATQKPVEYVSPAGSDSPHTTNRGGQTALLYTDAVRETHSGTNRNKCLTLRFSLNTGSVVLLLMLVFRLLWRDLSGKR